MPLVLIATPGAANANSYATVAEADAHASYRVGGAAFTALTSDQKIQALVTATRDIDSIGGAPYGFLGEPTTETQSLEWPRDVEVGLPAALVEATIELAMSYVPLFATSASPFVDPTPANIKSESVGPISTEYFAPGDGATSLDRFPAIVQRLLLSLIRATANAWGAATVTRSS